MREVGNDTDVSGLEGTNGRLKLGDQKEKQNFVGDGISSEPLENEMPKNTRVQAFCNISILQFT